MTTQLLNEPLLTRWEYEVNNFGGGNQERQMYADSPEFARIEDGELVVTAKRLVTNICGHAMPFTSGRVRTKRRFDFRYGTVSFEAKLPEVPGLWPAVWMMPTESAYGAWPRSGEIDILEAKNAEGTIYHAVHYGHSWERRRMKHRITRNPDPSGWVAYELRWQDGLLEWFVNSRKTFSVPMGKPFDQEFHLIINMAVGGQFTGREPKSTWRESEFRVRDLEVTS